MTDIETKIVVAVGGLVLGTALGFLSYTFGYNRGRKDERRGGW